MGNAPSRLWLRAPAYQVEHYRNWPAKLEPILADIEGGAPKPSSGKFLSNTGFKELPLNLKLRQKEKVLAH
jgi:hypothetical protein